MDSLQGSLHVATDFSHPNCYVKPVPTGWDEIRLRAFFSIFGEIDSVRICWPTPASRASVAHAFVRFKSTSSAAAAIARANGLIIEDTSMIVKLADADMAPRIVSGLCPSEWCYAPGLPSHYNREDVVIIFSKFGAIKDIKYFPSTENYRGSGALVQYEGVEYSAAAIQTLNGCLLPGATQPLLVRFADSPAEKAAKAARKEKVPQLSGTPLNNDDVLHQYIAEHVQLQQQLLELSLNVSSEIGAPPTSSLLTNSSSSSLNQNNLPMASHSLQGNNLVLQKSSRGCSIYIRNIPEDADKLWLYEKFARFGGIHSVRILLDEQTGRCNGIGFVNYTDPEAAKLAQETMTGVSMGDRLLHVMVQNHPPGTTRHNSSPPGFPALPNVDVASQMAPSSLTLTPSSSQNLEDMLPQEMNKSLFFNIAKELTKP